MKINTYKHWPPRVGDRVVRMDRVREGKRHTGTISIVDKDFEETVVHFDGHVVKFVIDCYTWQGMTVRSMYYRVDGIMYPPTIALLCPDLLKTDGTTDSFSFDELRGNWSTLEQAWWLA